MNVNTHTSVHIHGDLDDITCGIHSYGGTTVCFHIGPVTIYMPHGVQPEQFAAAISVAVADARIKAADATTAA